MTTLALLATAFACVTSVYLVYILFYVLEKICLVCMPVHFINLILFVLFTIKWNSIEGSENPRPGKSSAKTPTKKKRSKKEE